MGGRDLSVLGCSALDYLPPYASRDDTYRCIRFLCVSFRQIPEKSPLGTTNAD